MSFIQTVILGYLILIPTVTGLVRLRKVNRIYYPFILLLVLGTINETLGYYLIARYHSNSCNSNIFMLAEGMLITYQFNVWGLFRDKNNLLKAVIGSLATAWIGNNFFFGSLRLFNSDYTIYYSFVIVMMSIAYINRILVQESKSLLKNAQFIICICFLFFFTFQALTEIFQVWGASLSVAFAMRIDDIFVIIDMLTNLFFTYAILCMRTKLRFSMPL